MFFSQGGTQSPRAKTQPLVWPPVCPPAVRSARRRQQVQFQVIWAALIGQPVGKSATSRLSAIYEGSDGSVSRRRIARPGLELLVRCIEARAPSGRRITESKLTPADTGVPPRPRAARAIDLDRSWSRLHAGRPPKKLGRVYKVLRATRSPGSRAHFQTGNGS